MTTELYSLGNPRMPSVRQVVSRPEPLHNRDCSIKGPWFNLQTRFFTVQETSVSSSLDWMREMPPAVLLWGKRVIPISQPVSNLSRATLSPNLQPQQEPGKGQGCESEARREHVTILISDLGRRLVPVPRASLAHRGWPVAEDATEASGHRQDLDQNGSFVQSHAGLKPTSQLGRGQVYEDVFPKQCYSAGLAAESFPHTGHSWAWRRAEDQDGRHSYAAATRVGLPFSFSLNSRRSWPAWGVSTPLSTPSEAHPASLSPELFPAVLPVP